MDFSNPNFVWAFINAITGLGVGTYVMRYALKYANGKKPLRILSALLVLYFGFIYTLGVLGQIALTDLGPQYLRPFVPLFYLIPLFESRSDAPVRGH